MRWLKITLAVLVAATWFGIIVRHGSQAVGGADSSGYFNEAKLFASGRLRVPVPSPNFAPLGFVLAPDGKSIVPSYPPGYPLHLLLVWFAPLSVTPIAALACLIATFALAKTVGLNDEQSFGAALILATLPPFLLMSLQPMSDIVSMLWCTLAMLFALRRKSVLAGVAFAIAVWVRPSNLLLALPLSFSVGRRRLAGAILGAAPFAIALLALNKTLYGSPFTTGYGSIAYMLSWTNPITRAPLYLRWLALYVIGFVAVFDKRVERSTRSLFAIWFGVFFIFYSFFGPIGDWGYTRFLLPAIPPLILGILLLLRDHRAIAIVVTLALAINGWVFAKRQHIFTLRERESVYPQTIAWAERHLPRDATVAAMQMSGAFLYYADRLTFRYDFALPPPGAYAVVFDWEEANLKGHWKRLDRCGGAWLLQRDDVTSEVNPQHDGRDQR